MPSTSMRAIAGLLGTLATGATMATDPGDAALAAKAAKLPDLREVARTQVDPAHPERDVYALQAELAADLERDGRPYRTSIPFRDPPRPCRSGEHQVAHVEITIFSPLARRGRFGKGKKLTFTEAALHEAQWHGAKLTDEQRELLATLP